MASPTATGTVTCRKSRFADNDARFSQASGRPAASRNERTKARTDSRCSGVTAVKRVS